MNYFAFMSETHDRLQEARRKAGYENATDAARAFGWNEVTYRAHEQGMRGLKTTVAERYARAFKVTAAWLLTGQGGQDQESAEIIDIWSRIPERDRETARRVLDSFTKPK